jgi:hypothetical protein
MILVLQCNDKVPTWESGWDYCGVFRNRKEADRFIKEDVEQNFSPDSIHDDFSDFCNRYRICEVIAEIHPVPVLKTSIRLDETEISPIYAPKEGAQ